MRFIFGCRTADDLPSHRELQGEQKGQGEPGVTAPIICTDDGSVGFKGTVIDCLEQLIDPDPLKTELYACGPIPMLKAAAGYASGRNIRCWVSMEQIMGCAMGACMGCVIKTVKSPGYARVCLEGPVFDSAEILWE
jgi:dihydroorotate dehydrogenase electron transfer subunit